MPGMGLTGHYWFNFGKLLLDHGMTPVNVNSHHVKKSKELDGNHPSKNDRKDPKVIADLVKDGRYFRPHVPDGIYAEIRALSRLQVLVRSEITRLKNRIARCSSSNAPIIKILIGLLVWSVIYGSGLEAMSMSASIVNIDGIDGPSQLQELACMPL